MFVLSISVIETTLLHMQSSIISKKLHFLSDLPWARENFFLSIKKQKEKTMQRLLEVFIYFLKWALPIIANSLIIDKA